MQDQGAPYVCSLNKQLQEKAKKELNEKAERREKDIQALRDMVNAHPGLKCPTNDTFLLKFLRARKFNLDRAYALILNYYTVRAENPQMFSEFLPSKCEHIMGERLMMALPNRDKEGRKIIYFRSGMWDPTKVTEIDIAKFSILEMEVCLQEEETQVTGVVLIGDYHGLNMKQVAAMEKGNQVLPKIVQDAFPIRVKALHICKQPGILTAAWTIISAFIKEKLKNRIRFHGDNLKKLQQEIGVENLPEELGGQLGPADKLADAWYEKIRVEEKMFVEMQNYKIELSKPITKMKNDEVVDTLMGTYKKLNVD